MIYPLNEPITVECKIKPKYLAFLNHIPYKDYLFWFLKKKFAKKELIETTVSINPRIVEHPLVFKNLENGIKTILDVGSCESKLSINLASLGYEVYGIDLEDYPFSHPNFHFIKADIMKLPFPDNFFDCIISISTIEHIGYGVYGDPICAEGDKIAIPEMKRVLKLWGDILITMPYGGKPWPESSYWYGKCHWYNKDSLSQLLKNLNLNIEKKLFFIKHNENWEPASEIEAESIDPSRCIIFLKLRKTKEG